MSIEKFCHLKGFENNYLISPQGRIYSMKRGKFLKGTKNYNDTIIYSLCKNGRIHHTNSRKIMIENGLFKEQIKKVITNLKTSSIISNNNIDETFYPISGFEEQYLISSEGNVYSVKGKKLLKTVKNNKNVQVVNLYKNGKMHNTNIDRLLKDNGLYKINIENNLTTESVIYISDKKCSLEF